MTNNTTDMVDDLLGRIEKGVTAAQQEIVSSFKSIVEDVKNPNECSYSKNIGEYLTLKFLVRKLLFNVESSNVEDVNLLNRLADIKEKCEMTHKKMYESPCFECPACINRKKSFFHKFK